MKILRKIWLYPYGTIVPVKFELEFKWKIDVHVNIYPAYKFRLHVQKNNQKNLNCPIWFIILCLLAGASLSRFKSDYDEENQQGWFLNFHDPLKIYGHIRWIAMAWSSAYPWNLEAIGYDPDEEADIDDIPF